MEPENTKGWLPEGTAQGDLSDGDFAWLSDAYKRGDEPKSKGRKLPYKIKGTVNEDGWKAAWSRAHSMADADFEGGPTRAAVEAKLKKDKPADVAIEDDGKAASPRRERKTLTFKRGMDTGLEDNQFCGQLASFNGIDDGGDCIAPGAFANTIPDFLANGVVCWQHDWTNPIGKWLNAAENMAGLQVTGQISQTTVGKDALILLRDDVIKKMSIGYQPLGFRMLSDNEGAAMFGQAAYDAAMRDLPWYQDGIRVLTEIKLYEGSLVTVPMDPRADITGVKDLGLLAGLPHDAHFSAVLAAVDEYVARVKAIREMRAKAGRMLSAATAGKLQSMRDSMAEHLSTIDALLEANAPSDDPESDLDPDLPGEKTARAAIVREYVRYQQWQAQQIGA